MGYYKELMNERDKYKNQIEVQHEDYLDWYLRNGKALKVKQSPRKITPDQV